MARPRKTSDTDVLIAVETGFVRLEAYEEPILVRRGVTRAHRGSELARAYPTFFKPIDVHFPVEKMTAAPGEKRDAA